MEKMFPREKFIEEGQQRLLTQSLFLELGYTENALYTLKEIDHVYKGKEYPSIKRFYLEMEDTTEYEFANKYFLHWKHWQRICENKQILEHIEEWRLELEYKLRARAVKEMINLASTGSYQAVKWLADRNWDTRGAGRPSKEEKERNRNMDKRIADEYSADVLRLVKTG